MDHIDADDTSRRRGIVDTVKGWVSGVFGATRDKVEEVSAEVQHQTFRLLWMIVWSLVGILSLWLGLCFAMLTVIFGFDLPPKYAFGVPALVFLVVGAVAALMFQRTKGSKRKHRD